MKTIYYLNLIDYSILPVTLVDNLNKFVSRVIYNYNEIYIDNKYLFENETTAYIYLKTKLENIANLLYSEKEQIEAKIINIQKIKNNVENKIKKLENSNICFE